MKKWLSTILIGTLVLGLAPNTTAQDVEGEDLPDIPRYSDTLRIYYYTSDLCTLIFYTGTAEVKDVKDFYKEKMPVNGWSLSVEAELTPPEAPPYEMLKFLEPFVVLFTEAPPPEEMPVFPTVAPTPELPVPSGWMAGFEKSDARSLITVGGMDTDVMIMIAYLPSIPEIAPPILPQPIPPPEIGEANLTEDEVLDIARSHPEVTEFLAEYPDAKSFAYYDSYFGEWSVGFFTLEKADAYVTISDGTGEVLDVYVHYWPPKGTNLSEEEVIEIAKGTEEVQEFLKEHPKPMIDTWYTPELREWEVSFTELPELEFPEEIGLKFPSEPPEFEFIEPEFIYVRISDETGEVLEIGPPERYARLTPEEAIKIAKTVDEVKEFLAANPDAFESARYMSETEERFVDFMAAPPPMIPPEEPEKFIPESVTVIIDDETAEIKDVRVLKPSKITREEAISIAKTDPEMMEFLSEHPRAEIDAWYDPMLGEWVVHAYALEIWAEVTIYVDAQTGEIKTHMPTLDWEQALEIAKTQDKVEEFLDSYFPTSVNIYYDEWTNEWSVDFWDEKAGASIAVRIDAATGNVTGVYSFSLEERIMKFPEVPCGSFG